MVRVAHIIFVAFCLLSQAVFGQTDGTQTAAARAQRHQSYAKLSRQLFHTEDDPQSGTRGISVQRADQLQSQLHELICEEIMTDLAAGASATSIAGAITDVQGEQTDKPFVDLLNLNGTKEMAAGYVMARGAQAIPDTQPYLEFYSQLAGAWRFQAEAPTRSDFRGHTFSVARMNSGVPGEAWFLAWGIKIGNTGAPLSVRLYAFDGTTVRTVWRRDGLVAGDLSATSDTVTLEYDREYPRTLNSGVREVLHITANGLE